MSKAVKNNRGIALLITISVTTILVAAALEYNRRARLAIISTASARDRLTLAYMASSGVHIAMALLAKDKSESNFDSLAEDWAVPEKIEELLHSLKQQLTVVIVTHNMQQAARVSDNTGFFLLGELIEYDDTKRIFTNPGDRRTEDYVTGRFG